MRGMREIFFPTISNNHLICISLHGDIIDIVNERLAMSDKMLEQVARRFRHLAEPFRLRILNVLSQGEKSVGELVEALEGNQPNVSKHLQLLYDGGLISRRKQGTSNLYAISDPMIFELCNLVCQSIAEKNREEIEAFQEPRELSSRRSPVGAKRKDLTRGRTEEHAPGA